MLFIFLQMFADVAALSVATHTIAIYCDDFYLDDEMFNGDTSMDHFKFIPNECYKELQITIYIIQKYNIHYFVFYEGRAPGTTLGKMTFFSVYSFDTHGLVKCSEYPGKETNDTGMRVNCPSSYLQYSNIRIYSDDFPNLPVSEIEVHSLSADQGKNVQMYRGCFKSFGGTTTNMLLDECQTRCVEEEQIYTGVKKRTLCACSDSVKDKDEVPMAFCNIKCDDLVNDCGGNDTFSVYLNRLQLPYFLGCYEVSASDGYTANISGNMTIAKCLHQCETETYALLQDGDDCICTNKMNSSNLRNNSNQICTSLCSGDDTMFCGGKSHVSAFATCYHEKPKIIPLRCSQFFHCAGSYGMYGDCAGACKLGFTGDHCLKRNYFPMGNTSSPDWKTVVGGEDSINVEDAGLSQDGMIPNNQDTVLRKARFCGILDPCLNLSYSYCIEGRRGPVCDCIQGYTRNELNECEGNGHQAISSSINWNSSNSFTTLWKTCTIDFNECLFIPCQKFSKCRNLNGSYTCDCEPGSFRVADDICVGNMTRPLRSEYNITDNNIYGSDALSDDVFVSLLLAIPLVAFLTLVLHLYSLSPAHKADVAEDPVEDEKIK